MAHCQKSLPSHCRLGRQVNHITRKAGSLVKMLILLIGHITGVEINTGPLARGQWISCWASTAVESVLHWPSWQVKFKNPTSELT